MAAPALARTLIARSAAAHAASASASSLTAAVAVVVAPSSAARLSRHAPPTPFHQHHSCRWASSSSSTNSSGDPSAADSKAQQPSQPTSDTVDPKQEPVYAAQSAATDGQQSNTPSTAPSKEASLDDILGAALAPSLPSTSTSEPDTTAPAPAQARNKQPASRYVLASGMQPPPYRLHIMTSRNNTILTFTTPEGNPLASASGGTAGFKKSQRSGYEAGYRAAFQMFGHIAEYRRARGFGVGPAQNSAAARTFGGLVTAPTHGEEDLRIETIWNGFGQGREAVFRALMTNEGTDVRNLVKRVTDGTPLKIGGVRPKKRRML
ncbi:unnamed protein product [Tilletia controversa]|uniref:Uncharacterized protein n=3 Tax=Tilletia TaxID=13289 RepID=A0A8X7T0M3_9BASI|nr:hypothetical protein CF336_g573 [Tilletia laevis]KAE8204983.1 hypothetical protein CF328_g757 [Tilletia controversa]KAE8265321.1 hypothetical protein A4X03_0g344 [Tilletia caries]KAE8208638.1 hypothetical protein CF335_g269 [Tilletia laevis]KAE8254320.1 hypothetical protein A4X06_0g959 [Tilletia controversa]